MKKFVALVCILGMFMTLLVAAMQESNAVQAATSSDVKKTEGLVIDGEVGDTYQVGDLIFEIISDEEIERVMESPETRASTGRFNITLSGDSMSQDFEVTTSYPWAKVFVSNQGAGDIKFTITKGSKTGYLVTGSDVTIKAGKSTSVYSTKPWDPDTYYANYTCGSANMQGSSACRVASTQHELDI